VTRRVARHAGIFYLLLAALTLFCISSTAAVEPQSEYKIKGAYLYNFSRLVRLPEAHFRDDNLYNLCIAGVDPFGKILTPLRDRRVDGRPLSVDYMRSNKKLAGCEMLFISRSEEHKLDAWLQKASAFNILTVSDIDDFAHRGGMIGLVTRDNRVKFEINNLAAQRCNIAISAKLLELGNIVSDGHEEKSACRH